VTREYGGAGLGLAICRRLAKMLDGRIELDSQLGQGSVFTLVIPRKGKRR
jgi:signal transduction histidine kinase